MHLVYSSEFCITVVSNFSWVLQSSQEKSKTMDMQFFFSGGGGGVGGQGALLSMLRWWIAYEYSLFSSLLATREVSPWGTSAPQRQKFHTDDVKSVRNLVRSSDWSTWELYYFSYCLRTTDMRQTVTKVECKRDESTTTQSIFVEYILLQTKHLSFAVPRSQMNTKRYHNRLGET